MMSLRFGESHTTDVEVVVEDGVYAFIQTNNLASYKEWEDLSTDDQQTFATLMSVIETIVRKATSQLSRPVD